MCFFLFSDFELFTSKFEKCCWIFFDTILAVLWYFFLKFLSTFLSLVSVFFYGDLVISFALAKDPQVEDGSCLWGFTSKSNAGWVSSRGERSRKKYNGKMRMSCFSFPECVAKGSRLTLGV